MMKSIWRNYSQLSRLTTTWLRYLHKGSQDQQSVYKNTAIAKMADRMGAYLLSLSLGDPDPI